MTTSVAALMRVLQFGDSVLPIGSFAFSNGLESAVQEGQVRDLRTLREFVSTACCRAASTDGIALLEAHRAARDLDLDRLVRTDRALYSRKLNEETRTMSVRMGRKLVEIADHVLDSPLVATWLTKIRDQQTPGCYPVALGLLFAVLGLSERDAFAVHQYGVSMMMLSASLRLMRIRYADVQTILFDLNAEAEADYERYSGCTIDEMRAFAPAMDILAAGHAKAHVRLFMS